jgi:hypothetical protein
MLKKEMHMRMPAILVVFIISVVFLSFGCSKKGDELQFKPDKCEKLVGKSVRWSGVITQVDTNNLTTVLLYSQTDSKGNETVYDTKVFLPPSSGVTPIVGNKISIEGILDESFSSKTVGVLKGFDEIGKTIITVHLLPPILIDDKF